MILKDGHARNLPDGSLYLSVSGHERNPRPPNHNLNLHGTTQKINPENEATRTTEMGRWKQTQKRQMNNLRKQKNKQIKSRTRKSINNNIIKNNGIRCQLAASLALPLECQKWPATRTRILQNQCKWRTCRLPIK
jgi:hypothetical protein